MTMNGLEGGKMVDPAVAELFCQLLIGRGFALGWVRGEGSEITKLNEGVISL